MEKILGRKFTRTEIRGVRPVQGREFCYIEDDGEGIFDILFGKVVNAVQPPLAKDGGAMTEGCELTLPNGMKFHALSYKGNLSLWRQQIKLGAESLGLRLGQVEGDQFVLSSGERFILSDCKPRFY